MGSESQGAAANYKLKLVVANPVAASVTVMPTNTATSTAADTTPGSEMVAMAMRASAVAELA